MSSNTVVTICRTDTVETYPMGPNSTGASRGGLYIATGEEYVREAEKSAESFKESMSDVPVTLISDRTAEAPHFDSQRVVEDFDYDFGDIVANIDRTPFERTIYFDTDVYVNADVSEIFDMLDEFDIAASMDNHGWHIREYGLEHPINGVPEAFPWYNGGVIAYKKNERTREFFETWRTYYERNRANGITHNMISLRSALYHSDVRVGTLPWRYNCLIRKGNKVTGEVKLFHGRLTEFNAKGSKKQHNTEKNRKKLNRTSRPRIYNPTEYDSIEVIDDEPLSIETIDGSSNIAVRAAVSLREDGIRGTGKKLYDDYFARAE